MNLATLRTSLDLTGLLSGWRGLFRFWQMSLAFFFLAAGGLHFLGPPAANRPGVMSPQADAAKSTAPRPRRLDVEPVTPPDALAQRPGRVGSGPIGNVDMRLTEPAPGLASALLPRIGADGSAPMRSYAAPFDRGDRRPRVGLLVAGLGANEADTMAAIKLLPAGVSLAFSPYATNVDPMLAAARVGQLEYLLSIPMEPQGYPLRDPDDQHALMTALPVSENMPRLYWAMSRLTGYVGVTNAMGHMSGERLSGQVDQMEAVLDDIARRGLLFVDARPDKPRLPLAWNRGVDIVIDVEPLDAAAVDIRLDALTRLAVEKGSALGLVSLPRPKALERVAAWTTTLPDKGVILAPISALARPPLQGDAER